jgi:hypothetical protein
VRRPEEILLSRWIAGYRRRAESAALSFGAFVAVRKLWRFVTGRAHRGFTPEQVVQIFHHRDFGPGNGDPSVRRRDASRHPEMPVGVGLVF